MNEDKARQAHEARRARKGLETEIREGPPQEITCEPLGELTCQGPFRLEDLRAVPARGELRPSRAIERMLKRNV
jgi:hypothetical protein